MPAPNAQPPHPIDRHVGVRVRSRRMEVRLSQSALAERLGVSFQAVQKYETGSVRLSASRLYELARALGASPGYFFAGYDEAQDLDPPESADRRAETALLRGYYGIRSLELRTEVRRLIARLGDAPDLT